MAYPVKNPIVKAPGDGVKKDFEFSFKIYEVTDLLCYKGENEISGPPLLLNTDYTVTIYTDRIGGKVTYAVPPTVDQESIIQSNIPMSATLNLSYRGRFQDVQVLEALHRLTIQNQQQAGLIARALKVDLANQSTDPDVYLADLWEAISEANQTVNAQAAAQSALDAQQASSAASLAQTGAETAKIDAQTAQGLAEDARDEAIEVVGTIDFTKDNATDLGGASSSDDKVPSQLAVKTYTDNTIAAAKKVMEGVEVRTADPAGADLYTGRMFFRSDV